MCYSCKLSENLANTHEKVLSSLVNGEIKLKTIMRYHHTSIRMPKIF